MKRTDVTVLNVYAHNWQSFKMYILVTFLITVIKYFAKTTEVFWFSWVDHSREGMVEFHGGKCVAEAPHILADQEEAET